MDLTCLAIDVLFISIELINKDLKSSRQTMDYNKRTEFSDKK